MRNALCHGGGSVRNALCHGGGPGAGLCATRCVMAGPVAQRVVSRGRVWGLAHNALCHGGGSVRNALCHGGGPVVTRCVNGSWVDLSLCSSEEI